MTKGIKKATGRYYQPTPKFWRMVGDALLTLGTSVTAYSILEGDKTWTLISLFATVGGKFLTNFAIDLKEQNEANG